MHQRRTIGHRVEQVALVTTSSLANNVKDDGKRRAPVPLVERRPVVDSTPAAVESIARNLVR